MSQPTAWPYRFRLRGGRNTHAARNIAGFSGAVTACGYPESSGDKQKPDDAVITCRNCIREMNR